MLSCERSRQSARVLITGYHKQGILQRAFVDFLTITLLKIYLCFLGILLKTKDRWTSVRLSPANSCVFPFRQPIPRQPPSGADELREQYALSGRQPFSRHSLHGAYELRKQYAVAGLGISRSAERGNGFQKDRHPLRWFLSSWDSIFRPFGDTSERRNVPFLLRGGTEKRNGSTVTSA